jgi:formylmethanofuran dehydrogenase subunit B
VAEPTRAATADATCAGCGCGCDDIDVVAGAGRLERVERTCPLGDAWFAEHAAAAGPPARLDGAEADLADAVDAAADILLSARLPLVYGLGRTSCEAQREAVALAEAVGGVVDLAGAVLDGSSSVALHALGLSTATFGEVRDRAQLLVAWRVDPAVTHPRLLPRLHADRDGGASRDPERTLIVVDAQPTATAEKADAFIELPAHLDFEALWALRALVRGAPLDRALAGRLPLDDLERLAQRLRGCGHGAVLHGAGLGAAAAGHMNVLALFSLVRDLSRAAHVVAVPLRREANALGAENVLAWQTGYAGGVSFSRGYPRASRGEFDARRLLAHGEADAALIVASDPLEHLPAPAAAHLRRIPTVVVDSRTTATAQAARVAFATATAGVHRAGTLHRMDGVPLPLRQVLEWARADEREVLAAIGARVGALRNDTGETVRDQRED